MISRHLYPFIIIGILSVGMYMQWQHNKYLNLELGVVRDANKQMAKDIEHLANNQAKTNEAISERDKSNESIYQGLATALSKIGAIPDDGCLDKLVPVELQRSPSKDKDHKDKDS